ncbi:MAG TPA: ABC transporter permease [Candidatus Methylomirabilis sp.]|nr:ABC transporter permease [Candidatus Methylomirabilis sp.]
MPLTAGIRVALRALGRNRLRSALSMLGISIGVAAFICSLAVGEGASRQVEAQIRSLGDNLIWIEAGNRNVNGVRTGAYGTKSLTLEDARAIQQQIDLVVNVSPHVNTHVPVVYGDQNWITMVRGVGPEYLAVRRWQVARGAMFSSDDVGFAAKVCVLGQTVAASLFGEADPVGQTIRVQHLPCKVIGVLAVKGQSPTGQDQDDVLLMPFSTVQKKIKGISWLDDIMCSAVSAAALGPAEAEITALLRQRHYWTAAEGDDFNLRHPADLAQARAKSQRTLTLLLASIAAVALVVAGIGIMNIMLVSVTERTREIGIRLAVGARARDISIQFLLEALTLALFGGGLGLGLGLLGTYGIAQIAGWRILIRPETLVLAVAFAGATGIFFGYYPAQRASRLDPVEALGR